MASTAPTTKLIVFGGSGYVGSTIARLAVAAGVEVVGAGSSGRRPMVSRYAKEGENAWIEQVRWSKVDCTNRRDVEEFLDYHADATAVISSIGLMSLNAKQARRINGDANVNIAAATYDRSSIRGFVFVSAAIMKPVDKVLGPGYYYGKGITERAIVETLHGRGVALRPGMVSGTRIVTNLRLPLPLQWIGGPMETIFRPLHRVTGLSILTPPTPVETLARAALHAALQAPIGENAEIVEYNEIAELAAQYQPNLLLGTHGSAPPRPAAVDESKPTQNN